MGGRAAGPAAARSAAVGGTPAAGSLAPAPTTGGRAAESWCTDARAAGPRCLRTCRAQPGEWGACVQSTVEVYVPQKSRYRIPLNPPLPSCCPPCAPVETLEDRLTREYRRAPNDFTLQMFYGQGQSSQGFLFLMIFWGPTRVSRVFQMVNWLASARPIHSAGAVDAVAVGVAGCAPGCCRRAAASQAQRQSLPPSKRDACSQARAWAGVGARTGRCCSPRPGTAALAAILPLPLLGPSPA
jgi:hypothetical protein